MKASFDTAPEAEQLPPDIGLSVGSVEVPTGTADLLPLVNEADTRMYKDKGRFPERLPSRIAQQAAADAPKASAKAGAVQNRKSVALRNRKGARRL